MGRKLNHYTKIKKAMRIKALLAALLLMVGVQTTVAQKVVLYKSGGETIKCSVSELDSIVFIEEEPVIGPHEWIDLGLPSGTLWATCNIGADNPEDYGDFFAWGETEPKSIYDTGHYKFNKGSGKMTKYCTISSFGSNGFTDGLTELEPKDDAATANWGSEWQMPSMDQMIELIDTFFTKAEWTTLNDFIGKKITSKRNGNWIFFPAAGYCDDSSIYRRDNYGSCWSRSLIEESPRDAYVVGFTWIDVLWGGTRRYKGLNVRPVRVEKIPRVLVAEIVLSDNVLNLLPDESKSITATVLPSNAFFPNVKWESSDESVATVNSAGLVTAFFPGTCTITCRAVDGSGAYAECQVTVAEPNYEW